jgi:tetratricopeptide (TPR) repeat protein
LAIAVVAARVASAPHCGLAEALAQLRVEQNLFDALVDADAVVDIRSVFSWSLQALTPPAADLFRLLALNRSLTWDEQVAASLSRLPVPGVRRLLAELVSANLVVPCRPGTFMYHDLIRVYAAELAAALPPQDRRDAIHRLLDHYVTTGQNADSRLDRNRCEVDPVKPQPGTVAREFANHDETWAWFVAQREPLLMAQRLAADEGFDDHVWRIAWVLQTHLGRIGKWQQSLAVENAARGAVERLDNPLLVARTHSSLGRINARVEHHGVAHDHLTPAVEMFLTAGQDEPAASASINLGNLVEDMGQIAEPVRIFEHVLELTDDEQLRATALNNVASAYNTLGDFQRAMPMSLHALRLFSRLGDRHGEASAWETVAYAHHHLGRHVRAARAYRRTIATFEALGDDVSRADALRNLGDCLAAAGDEDEARDAWRTALEIMTRLGLTAAEDVRARLDSLQAA